MLNATVGMVVFNKIQPTTLNKSAVKIVACGENMVISFEFNSKNSDYVKVILKLEFMDKA